MILKQYYLGCLAHASYLLGDEASATAIVALPSIARAATALPSRQHIASIWDHQSDRDGGRPSRLGRREIAGGFAKGNIEQGCFSAFGRKCPGLDGWIRVGRRSARFGVRALPPLGRMSHIWSAVLPAVRASDAQIRRVSQRGGTLYENADDTLRAAEAA